MIIDLTQAQFFGNLSSSFDSRYGQYDFTTQVIRSAGFWPDWYLPYVLDPSVTYTIRYKYDSLEAHDTGGRGFWITGLRPDHITEDYTAAANFGVIWNWDDNDLTDDHTITIGPGISNWNDPTYGPGQGYTLPYFETDRYGSFSYLEITPDPIPVALTPWPEDTALVSGHNQAAPAVDSGDDRPYFSRYWTYLPDTEQDLDLDTFASLAADLTAADTQIWVFYGQDFEWPNYLADNDDANIDPNDLLSEVTFHALPGITYHIRVGSYDADEPDGITVFDLNAPFTGTNLGGTTGGGGGGITPPDPPDPEAAYYLTEIVSTLLPATGKVVATYAWTQVSPGSPTLDLHPNGPVLRFVNPPLLADTDFVVRLTITDNLGGTSHEDHTVHVKAHNHWQLKTGTVHGIQTVRDLSTKYVQERSTRSTHDLLAPYETVAVYDGSVDRTVDGNAGLLATFTTGSRSVLLTRDPDLPSGSISTTPDGTFSTSQRLYLLPAPFTGTVDEVLLDEMLASTAPDAFDIIKKMVDSTASSINGVQVYGPNAYDPVADFNDYLGITFAGDAPDLTKTGKLSPQGFIRLLFGPLGLGLPITEIPADMVGQVGSSAPGVNVIDPETYVPSADFIAHLQMGDVLGFTSADPVPLHHVGIYLGSGRFASMRQDKDNVSADDGTLTFSSVLPYAVPLYPKYAGWFRSARRY